MEKNGRINFSKFFIIVQKQLTDLLVRNHFISKMDKKRERQIKKKINVRII